MRNFRHPGNVLTLIAPYALASGQGFKTGAIFAVATSVAAQGAPIEGQVTGVVDLPRATGAGSGWDKATPVKLYWDDTNRVITKTAGANLFIGVSLGTAADGDATGTVRLSATFA